jgi:hypothetical protein
MFLQNREGLTTAEESLRGVFSLDNLEGAAGHGDTHASSVAQAENHSDAQKCEADEHTEAALRQCPHPAHVRSVIQVADHGEESTWIRSGVRGGSCVKGEAEGQPLQRKRLKSLLPRKRLISILPAEATADAGSADSAGATSKVASPLPQRGRCIVPTEGREGLTAVPEATCLDRREWERSGRGDPLPFRPRNAIIPARREAATSHARHGR